VAMDDRWEIPRRRVALGLPPGMDRDAFFDRVAGCLLRELSTGAGLFSFEFYAEGEGFTSDPATVTAMWEIIYRSDEHRGDRGTSENDRLAELLSTKFPPPASVDETLGR
jgi:hypothetical protein